MFTLELYEFKNLCMEMAELGVANYVRKMAPAKDLLSQRKAFDLFQESRVRRWVTLGIVNPVREGSALNSKKLYSRAELLAADESEKLKSLINKK